MSLELALEQFLDKGAAMGTGAGAHPSPHHRAVQLPPVNSSVSAEGRSLSGNTGVK